MTHEYLKLATLVEKADGTVQWTEPASDAGSALLAALTEIAAALRDAAARSQEVREAIASLRACMAFDVRDWAVNRRDAWLYGIITGWSGAIDEVAKKHNWPSDEVARLKRMAAAFEKAANQPSPAPLPSPGGISPAQPPPCTKEPVTTGQWVDDDGNHREHCGCFTALLGHVGHQNACKQKTFVPEGSVVISREQAALVREMFEVADEPSIDIDQARMDKVVARARSLGLDRVGLPPKEET